MPIRTKIPVFGLSQTKCELARTEKRHSGLRQTFLAPIIHLEPRSGTIETSRDKLLAVFWLWEVPARECELNGFSSTRRA